MQIQTPAGTLILINEPVYSFGSADNSRQYPIELLLDDEYSPSSVHGILLDGNPLVVLGDAGGCTGVHKHSVVLYNEAVYVAVGRHVTKLVLFPFSVAWSLQVDDATCFGVHANVERNALLSHGELGICRFSEIGEILWSVLGADIFSEGFSLHQDHVEAVDFNHNIYKFGYEDGELRV